MGCVSSKVGQKPGEQTPGHRAPNNEGQGAGESRAVEFRPAQPVVESNGPSNGPPSKTRGQGKVKGGPKIQALHGEEARRTEGGEEEKEGETVTDATGLQMRTPRTNTDRGLHYAAKNGDLTLLHQLLDHNIDSSGSQLKGNATPDRTVAADLNERGMWGNTPLLLATQYAHPQVALALIAGGANTCLENERRATALHFSCAEGLLDVCQALLENGAEVDPLVAAIHHPAVNGGQTVPVTPLSAASSGGHAELVRLLVERGAEVDRRVSPKRADGHDRRSSFSGVDGIGGSALSAAARYGHTETCLQLIESGASVLLEDWDGRTPLMHAILGGHARTSLALLDVARKTGSARQLAEPGELGMSGVNPSKLSPLQAACDGGLHTVAKKLVEAGAQTESRDGTGATPLLHACRKGQLQCVRELLSGGADPMAEDDAGTTPLSAARSRIEHSQGEEIVRLIEAAVAGSKGREDRPHPIPAKQDSQHQGEDEGKVEGTDDDDDEDVLLVSDWDDNVDGVDVLDDCDILDASSHAADCEPPPALHTIEIEGQSEKGLRGTTTRIEAEDEDVLLVGDYDPDLEEEEEAGLTEVSSPLTSPPRASSSQEPLNENNLMQARRNSASSGNAQSTADRTSRHSNEEANDRELKVDDPGNWKNGAKSDLHSEDGSALKNHPQTPSNGILPPIALGGESDPHPQTQEVTSRLPMSQVAADSVDMVLATAAERISIAVGQPPGGGGG